MKLTDDSEGRRDLQTNPHLGLKLSITQEKEKKMVGGNLESITMFTVNQQLSVL